jgi:hypothetical protein
VQIVDIEADEPGAAHRAGEAEQDDGLIAKPRQAVRNSGDHRPDCSADDRRFAGRCYAAGATDTDPPPMKWSDSRYVFDIKEDCNGQEALQA